MKKQKLDDYERRKSDFILFKGNQRKEQANENLQRKDRDISDAIHKHEMYLENQRNSYLRKEQEKDDKFNEFQRK